MSYSARFIRSIGEVERDTWESMRPDDNPFLSYDFLQCLEDYGGAAPKYGWHPLHCVLEQKDRVVGVAPNYLKENSHGEFVFDWSWADAFERSGRPYYPKFLCAVPYSPVTGPRLLVGPEPDSPEYAVALASAIIQQSQRMELSSCHFNFVSAQDAEAFREIGLLERGDWQFHWTNPGYRDLADMLDQFRSKKRKNVLQERRRVHDQGFEFIWASGEDITDEQLDTAYDCYRLTFHYKGNIPVLSKTFFEQLNRRIGIQIQYCLAYLNDKPVAAAIFLRSSTTLYGRYWGCYEEHPGLHFETCYYQGLEKAIEWQLQCFEPGAQGPHKISRGFLPTPTMSFHHVSDSGFKGAIADFLNREKRHRQAYGEELKAKSPYRQPASAT